VAPSRITNLHALSSLMIWIRIGSDFQGPWIRIRIQNADPDPGVIVEPKFPPDHRRFDPTWQSFTYLILKRF